MGIHVCQFCVTPEKVANNWYDHTSSGDVILSFESGRTWEMPDMILHYMMDHRFLPPREFVSDIVNSRLILEESTRLQTKGLSQPTKVGYLVSPDFETGQVSSKIIARLESLMGKARDAGQRFADTGGA